jgi:two-component system, cell cycle response regulator DivK
MSMQITKDSKTWRVLVVDDEPDNLNLVVDLLGFHGATVTQARNGQLALDLVDQFKPNLILLDLAMPEIDGWETHTRLRARRDLDDVPIVALTALAMAADADRVRAAGFDAYITKPFRVRIMLEQLTACIETFTNTRAAKTQALMVQEANHD